MQNFSKYKIEMSDRTIDSSLSAVLAPVVHPPLPGPESLKPINTEADSGTFSYILGLCPIQILPIKLKLFRFINRLPNPIQVIVKIMQSKTVQFFVS